MDITVRPENAEDLAAIRSVNRAAFGSPAEADLVDALRDSSDVELSLVAEVEGELVGHLLLSRATIRGRHVDVPALALAPMCVTPTFQGRGIGSRLVQEGLAICRARGHRIVTVLGHPDFYPRFGFRAAKASSLHNPFGSGAAWMAVELSPGALEEVRGEFVYATAFDDLA